MLLVGLSVAVRRYRAKRLRERGEKRRDKVR